MYLENTEEINKIIDTLSEIVVTSQPTVFTRQSAAFESQDAVDIFSGKCPADFIIDWIVGNEAVLFFLPDDIYYNFLPAFLLTSAKEFREKQNISVTTNLFCILVERDYTNRKEAMNFIKEFNWCFSPMLRYATEMGIISEADAEAFKSIR